MKRLNITTIVLLMVFAIGCNKTSQESPSSKSPATQSAPATVQSSQVSPDTLANRAADTPVVASQSTTAPGMNPPHGQPNHRCDIAVGAPLNSPAGTGLTPPTGTQLTVPAQPTVTSTAPGMNPPHGQPNHRCDIAVGAPLNSPPGTTK